jgi:hypothetical protein
MLLHIFLIISCVGMFIWYQTGIQVGEQRERNHHKIVITQTLDQIERTR